MQFEEVAEGGRPGAEEAVYQDALAACSFYAYYCFCKQRRRLLESDDLRYRLVGEHSHDLPAYVLRYVHSTELALKDDDVYQHDRAGLVVDRRRKIDDLTIKLLDYDDFDEVLAEYDRYVRDAKKKPSSPVYAYCRANSLFSLVYTKPSEESLFRYMDIRLRVHLYDMKRSYIALFAHMPDTIEALQAPDMAAASDRIQRLVLLTLIDQQLSTAEEEEERSVEADFCVYDAMLANRCVEFRELDSQCTLRNIVITKAMLDGNHFHVRADQKADRGRYELIRDKYSLRPVDQLDHIIKMLTMVSIIATYANVQYPGVNGCGLPSVRHGRYRCSNVRRSLRELTDQMTVLDMMNEHKHREMATILGRYRDSNNKDADVVYKNSEFDHIVNMHLAAVARVERAQPALDIDYTETAAVSSFVGEHLDTIEKSYAFLLHQLTVAIVGHHSAVLSMVKHRPHPLQQAAAQHHVFHHLIDHAYDICANEEDVYYIVHKEDMMHMVGLVHADTHDQVQRLYRAYDRHYGCVYLRSAFNRLLSAYSYEKTIYLFTHLIHDFHKLIEAYLSQYNFSIIYELDQFHRYIRYMVYDSNILHHKCIADVHLGHVAPLVHNVISQFAIETRDKFFLNHIAMNVKDFIYTFHNSHMHQFSSSVQQLLDGGAEILDMATGQPLSAALLIEQQLVARTNDVFQRLKELYHLKYVRQLHSYGRLANIETEHLHTDDGLKKKIRELTVRESLLKEELQSTKIEMEALTQQNSVLERDIHICNYERLNLTKQLQATKEKLEKLKAELFRQTGAKQKGRKSILPPLLKEASDYKQQSPLHAPAFSGFPQTNLRIDEAESGSLESDEALPSDQSTPAELRRALKKKSRFTFANGKLERKYKVAK